MQHDFVDKSLCEKRRPHLNQSDSRRFIDESSRKSESLIYAIIIQCIEKLGTASACRERQ